MQHSYKSRNSKNKWVTRERNEAINEWTCNNAINVPELLTAVTIGGGARLNEQVALRRFSEHVSSHCYHNVMQWWWMRGTFRKRVFTHTTMNVHRKPLKEILQKQLVQSVSSARLHFFYENLQSHSIEPIEWAGTQKIFISHQDIAVFPRDSERLFSWNRPFPHQKFVKLLPNSPLTKT